MPIKFDRPVGPHRDVKELEYLSALHQTATKLRPDGSITEEDVIAYLRSRHGIDADANYIREQFMPGLAGALGGVDEALKKQADSPTISDGGGGGSGGGGNGRDNDKNTPAASGGGGNGQDNDTKTPAAVFDLVEITCILLIPYFLQQESKRRNNDTNNSNNDDDDGGNVDFFQLVLDIILRDALGSSKEEEDGPVLLNREVVQMILECYNEDENARPEDIDAMLLAAGVSPSGDGDDAGGGIPFTADVLARATTGDVQKHYRLEWETSTTTHFDDVFSGTFLDTAGNEIENKISSAVSSSLQRLRVVVPPTLRKCTRGTSNNDSSSKGDPTSTAGDRDSAAEEHHHAVVADQASSGSTTRPVKRLFTFASIDYVAENFRSVHFTVLLWLCFIIGYFSYVVEVEVILGTMDCDRFHSDFGCRVVNSIVAWLVIFLQLSILGSAFIILGSAGNSVYSDQGWTSLFYILVGMAVIVFATLLSYVYPVRTFFADTNRSDDPADNFVTTLTLLIGLVLILFQMKIFLFIIVPKRWYKNLPLFRRFLVSGIAIKESKTKQAARFKVDSMVEKAIHMHLQSTSPKDALLAFESTIYDREQVGGILWTFRNMWNGSLFVQEGIWLHSRLIASNLSQVFVVAFFLILIPVIYFAFVLPSGTEENAPTVSPAPTRDPVEAAVETILPVVEYVFGLFDGSNDEVKDVIWSRVNGTATAAFTADILDAVPNATLTDILNSLTTPTVANLVSAGNQILVDAGLTDFHSSRHLEEDDFIDYLTPEPWNFIFAGAVAFFATIPVYTSFALIWIPSSVSTILQFRSGVIGSLRDKDFARYRVAPDLTCLLFGSTFWGSIFATLWVFLLSFAISFLAVWEPTRSAVLFILSQIVAISVTMLTKVLVLLCLRKLLFRGMFRIHPASSNVTMVVLEVWSLGLTVGSMMARLVKLILVSAIYVGRIDTFFFANGVGEIGPIILDAYPVQFRKDLLVHDAHRHPYMERLGQIYMTKLRHSDDFGLPANSAWRLIVVQALMPWLRRYRIEETVYDQDGNIVVPGEDAIDREGDPASEVKRLKTELLIMKKRMQLLEKQPASRKLVVDVEDDDESEKEC